MKTPYRILKLRSGEEIIARIRGEKQGKLILERPMIFKTVMVASPYGTQKEITILKNWLSFTNAIETKIPKDFIATYLEPDHTVVELYDLEKEKEDINPPTPKKIIDAMKKLTDENIKDMFDMISEDLSDMPFPPDGEEEENMISLSMFFPPEALLSLVDAGLLDVDDVQKLIDTLSNPQRPQFPNPFGNWGSGINKLNDDGKRYGEYTGDDEDRKSSDDYGKDWHDWSSDPNDYL